MHAHPKETLMRYFCTFLLLCAHALLISGEHPSHLKAFIVYDASNSSLQQCYRQDSIRMRKSLKAIASLTKLSLNIQTVKASQLHPTKLFSWIHSLSPKDVAVFYYAGKPQYGFGQWPYLSFPHIKCIVTQTQLTNELKQKKPHLSLVLFDRYNSVAPFRWTHTGKNPSIKAFSKAGMTRLFLKSSGMVSACSSTRGEVGYAIQHKGVMGGIFSLGIQHFFQSCDPKTALWYDFVVGIKSLCIGASNERQHPLMLEDIKNPSMHHSHIKSQSLNESSV
jgi:hypothetical protein